MAAMELVATKVGFYQGQRIRVGQSFTFEGTKAPKWAMPADAAQRVIEEDRRVEAMSAGDTKPIEAQRAVRKKSGDLRGD